MTTAYIGLHGYPGRYFNTGSTNSELIVMDVVVASKNMTIASPGIVEIEIEGDYFIACAVNLDAYSTNNSQHQGKIMVWHTPSANPLYSGSIISFPFWGTTAVDFNECTVSGSLVRHLMPGDKISLLIFDDPVFIYQSTLTLVLLG